MKLHLLSLQNKPIFEQLQLEESLLRADDRNWCLINMGSPRAIVMGLSSEPEKLLHIEKVKQDEISVIQRFSGGGTVIVDESTLFVTFIFQKNAHPIAPYPKPILEWTTSLYQEAWGLPSFGLRENDYALGEKKIGGNAQYLRQTRWLHHTTFLWDFAAENMSYLQIPERQPAYRQKRDHHTFLTTLKPLITKENLQERLIATLQSRFDLLFTEIPKIITPHRQTTQFVRLQ